jgi:hypothetical protein
MPESNPVTVVVAEILRRIEAPVFRPFAIRLSDGRDIVVPTRDHCTVTRLLRRIEVETDDVRIIAINPLQVTSIEDVAA